jgi:signal transduction histidine kinase
MTERTDVPALRRPWSEGRSRAFDAVLTTVLLLPVLVFPFTSVHRSATLLSFIEIVPLLMRRVQPAGCFYTVTAATALQLALIDTPIWGQVAMPVAVFAVAAYESTVTARVALAASLVLAVAGPAVWVAGEGLPAQQVLLWFSTAILLMVASWALGSMVRARRAYAAEVLVRGERLEERAALADDLATDDGEPDVPPHGVDDVRALVEQARQSGMRVDAEVADPMPEVPDLTGLTAYRIVQEALANVRAHAGPAAAVHVSVRVIGVDLVVEILDDGVGTSGSLEELQGERRGLAGIRELVSGHGGHLEAGPRPGGGFAVRARLPLLSREPQA